MTDASDLLKNTWISSLQDAARASGVSPAAAPVDTVRMHEPVQPINRGGTHFFTSEPLDREYAASATPAAWYANPLFLQFATATTVFLLTFVLLIAIRPAFLYTKPKEKLKEREFSAKNAAWLALGTTVAAAIIMVALALVNKAKAK